MRRASVFLFFLFCVFVGRTPSGAQFAPPNESGVTLAHIHLIVADMDAHGPTASRSTFSRR